MKIFFRCIGNTVLGLMLVMALVLLIPGLFGICDVVYSGSMEPEIPQPELWFLQRKGEFSPKREISLLFITEIPLSPTEWLKKKRISLSQKVTPTRQNILFPQRGVTDHRAGSLSPALSGYVIHFLKAR